MNMDCCCFTCDSTKTASTSSTSTKYTTKIPREFKISHIVRDLLSKNKKDYIISIIQQNNYDIFCISETWLWCENNDDELQIPFNMLRQNRKEIKNYHTRGGGLLIYYKEQYDVTCHDSPFPSPVESIKISIKPPFLPTIYLYLIYRVSTVKKVFIEQLHKEILTTNNNETIVIGDLNYDILNPDNQTRELMSTMNQLGFHQLIKQATRITDKTKTLIDLIFTNRPTLKVKSGVIDECVADHNLIYTVRRKLKTQKCPLKSVEIRTFKNTVHTLLNTTQHNTFIFIYFFTQHSTTRS